VEQYDSNQARKFQELHGKCDKSAGDFAKDLVRAISHRYTYA
jgi:hypothetical protein